MTKSTSINKLIDVLNKVWIYLLGLGVIILNYSLAFDNVVWGDEAYSQMAIINTNLHGVYERVYYWDSHPPLYYYYLKFIADIFGYQTPVYHIASLVPFTIGIILACTLIKKHIGLIPAALFIIISGLSESCVEYNLEIRMYSLVFMFVLLSSYIAYRIICGNNKAIYFVLLTLFGVLGAYTHYYGLAVCGLIVFFTGLFNLLNTKEHKGQSILKWVLSTILYIVCYIPWLFVLYFQTQAELGASWMTEPDALSLVLRFICGGGRLKPIILPLIIGLSIVILIKDSGLLSISKGHTKCSVEIALNRPSKKNWSDELKTILLMWVCIGGLLGFGYGVSYGFHPILAYRYTYVLIPLTLMILMLSIKRIISYVYDFTMDKNIAFSTPFKGFMSVLLCILLLAVLLLSLFDFKYFRSVTKTQNVQTNMVLDIVGTPSENAVLVSNGVKHLSWSVLPYYYDNEVTTWNPDEVEEKLGISTDEFWCFNGYEYEDKYIRSMKKEGYTIDEYPDMWLGKYNIYLYHFYK